MKSISLASTHDIMCLTYEIVGYGFLHFFLLMNAWLGSGSSIQATTNLAQLKKEKAPLRTYM